MLTTVQISLVGGVMTSCMMHDSDWLEDIHDKHVFYLHPTVILVSSMDVTYLLEQWTQIYERVILCFTTKYNSII